MYKVNPHIEYLDQRSLDRMYDEIALNEYLRAEKEIFDEDSCLYEYLECLLRELLENLSQERQVLLHLRFWKDLSESEISYKMGLSLSEVKWLLQDTLTLLKGEILAAFTPSPPPSKEDTCWYE